LAVTYLKCIFIEPVSNIGSSREHDRVALWLAIVIEDQLCQVIHLVEQRYPAITACVVCCNFFWSVVIAQFVRTWEAFSVISLHVS